MYAQQRALGSRAASSRLNVVAPRPMGRRTTVIVEARKVVVLGAGGGIGQPLSLLLKMNRLVTELALYDIFGAPGVAADLSHCNTSVKVTAYGTAEDLGACLTNADIVVIPAGVPRKPGMTRDDLFNTNAGIIRDLAVGIAKYCPNAIVEIITNPVNSTVPIVAEVLKTAGVYNPSKVLGVTTLDVVRSNTFVAEARHLDVKDVDVPVIGGHAGITILPLLSQATPKVSFTDAEKAALTEKIQNAGTVVVEAKAGKGSATLSMAYSAARFTESVLLALNGEPNIYECAFVDSPLVPGTPYFASKVLLGPHGVAKILPFGELDAFEKGELAKMMPELNGSIKKGIEFAHAKA